MAKIINLNKIRKQRARKASRAEADANAAKFGRTAAQRDAEASATKRHEKSLDQTRLDTPPEGADFDNESP